ncbi:sulfotransferase family 2 domain-containing protein [Lysobacter yangpyeongensis]|uniref:Sulfotransferase family 2 domain-containing protein n=1 Tax=Lysobacter yangpyeongensis TaxID=346182 RepID=A0ABW0SP08_9GAMM
MVISHRHRFLHFVIPKTASATLRQSLAPFADIGWPVSKYQQHVTIAAFLRSEHAPLFPDYFKFAFVRNPYDRIYSGYLQDRYAAETYPRWIRAKKPLFDEIGDDFSTYFNEYALKADLENDWQWICFCPMSAFTVDAGGKLAMDFVGRAENLAQDIATLASRLRLPLEKAPDENVRQGLCSAEPKYLPHFDRRTIFAVNATYRRDFELFGYPMLDPDSFPERAQTLPIGTAPRG